MRLRRVALIFDDRRRPDTTGVYVRRALAELVEVVHFPPDQAHLIPAHFIGRAYFEEMARIYSASRVVFNRSIKNDVNMRVFEAVACGSLLVTNDLADHGQAELFGDGVHLVTYREPGEMVETVGYY